MGEQRELFLVELEFDFERSWNSAYIYSKRVMFWRAESERKER